MKRPSARILVTFAITMVMLSLHFSATFLGLLPDTDAIKREARASLAEVLTVRTVRHLAASELGILQEGLELLVERNADILSAAVRRGEGDALIHVGEHDANWETGASNYSTDKQLMVPIMEGGARWGQLELRFQPLRRAGWLSVLDSPLAHYSFYLAVVGFIALYFVLGKMLRHLDPAKAVPSRVRSALDTMMEGLIAVDLKGQIVLANHAFATVSGRTADALLGAKIDSLAWRRSDKSTRTDLPWQTTLRDGIPCTSTPIHFTDGESKKRTFLVNCSPVMGGEGKHVGVLVGLGDVTELEEKEIELRLSKQRAEAANKAKSEFLANMSHEIRTPMNAILGFTEMLRSGYARSEGDQKKYLNTIHSSGTFLLELINDLLDLSKVESGAMELERVRCPVHQVAQEVVNVLSVRAAERDIALKLEVHDPIPATISTDPLRLRQIITNLVGNAIKFTEAGSVRVGLRYDAVAAPKIMTIDVTDTGIGMSAEQIAKIFDPFVQADQSITRRFGGTGLGLSISKRFADALGGGIVVTSEPGVGSVFSVQLDVGSLDDVPLLSPQDALQADIVAEETTHDEWVFPRANILVADDNKQNRDLLSLVLGEHGLHVTEAVNGQEAVNAARRQDFDLVLMDLEMPIMDGATATRALRSAGLSVPILALTAHAIDGIERKLKDAGFSEYIAKPINIKALVERLAEFLGAVADTRSREPEAFVALTVGDALDADESPIRSRLPVHDPRYRAIVVEFIEELDDRLGAMENAQTKRDFAGLANLAHAFKGVAGGVGFDEFTEPTKVLEAAAQAQDPGAAQTSIALLRALAERVEMPQGPMPIQAQSA